MCVFWNILRILCYMHCIIVWRKLHPWGLWLNYCKQCQKKLIKLYNNFYNAQTFPASAVCVSHTDVWNRLQLAKNSYKLRSELSSWTEKADHDKVHCGLSIICNRWHSWLWRGRRKTQLYDNKTIKPTNLQLLSLYMVHSFAPTAIHKFICSFICWVQWR